MLVIYYTTIMVRYRHWQNRGEPGDTVFITTTALDFAPVFRQDDAKDRVVARLFEDHRFYGAVLDAYVVMWNHLHLVSRLPSTQGVAWFVQRLKSHIARDILPTLDREQRGLLAVQTTLNRHAFWQRSFRSVVIDTDPMLWQKVSYIHENPLRAKLVSQPEEYRWSSAAFYRDQSWTPESGLMAVDSAALFGPNDESLSIADTEA